MSTVAEKPPAKTAKKKKYKFRLLRGQHVEGKGADRVVYQADVRANNGKGNFPLIETDKDLTHFNGEFAKQQKFERVYDEPVREVIVDPTVRRPGETIQAFLVRMSEHIATIKTQTDSFVKSVDSMNLEQLKELCEAEEIELPDSAKTLDQVRAVVKKALKV